MGLLMWTSSILCILSLLSTALFFSFTEQNLMLSYIEQQISHNENHSFLYLSTKARNTYYEKTKEVVLHAKKTKKRVSKPRLTSKVHVTPETFIAMKGTTSNESLQSPQEKLLYNLLCTLYKGIGKQFALSDQETINRLLKALSEAFTRYEGQFSKDNVKVLANFELLDSSLQPCFWDILHGKTKGDQVWPSLLSYINFKKHHGVITSLWLAPKAVLFSIFENEKTVEEICEKRRAVSEVIRKNKNEKNSEAVASAEAEFRALCEKQMPTWLPMNLVEYKISSSEPME